MGRRRQEAMRWKLELPGTNRQHAQAVESAVDEIGWRRCGSTEILFGPALTRIYIETDVGESAEHIAMELLDHSTGGLPSVTGSKPTTWPKVFAQLREVKAVRRDTSRHHAVTRPGPTPRIA